jgi:AcrR family transcriptional regulator
MIDATVDALSRHGVAGMSFTEILQTSGAARGAIYHHFPNGKGQLVAEATARFGDQVRDTLGELAGADPQAVVEAFLATVRPVVAASVGGHSCAVAAASVGSTDDDELRGTAGGAFRTWLRELTVRLAGAGLPEKKAADTAALLISMLEGAQVVCRAIGDIEPFDAAARAARELIVRL